MSINETDTFLVKRSNNSYQLEAQNLMAELQDTDLMLVNRDGTSYKATGAEIKDSLGAGSISPNPGDIIWNGGNPSGSGTSGDPFVLDGAIIYDPDINATSDQSFSLSGYLENEIVVIEDLSQNTGTKFTQPIYVFSSTGSLTISLVFRDIPRSGTNTEFAGKFKLGNVYINWNVNVILTAAPEINTVVLSEDNPAAQFANALFNVDISMDRDGTPRPTTKLKGTVNGTLFLKPEQFAITNIDDVSVNYNTKAVKFGGVVGASSPGYFAYSWYQYGSVVNNGMPIDRMGLSSVWYKPAYSLPFKNAHWMGFQGYQNASGYSGGAMGSGNDLLVGNTTYPSVFGNGRWYHVTTITKLTVGNPNYVDIEVWVYDSVTGVENKYFTQVVKGNFGSVYSPTLGVSSAVMSQTIYPMYSDFFFCFTLSDYSALTTLRPKLRTDSHPCKESVITANIGSLEGYYDDMSMLRENNQYINNLKSWNPYQSNITVKRAQTYVTYFGATATFTQPAKRLTFNDDTFIPDGFTSTAKVVEILADGTTVSGVTAEVYDSDGPNKTVDLVDVAGSFTANSSNGIKNIDGISLSNRTAYTTFNQDGSGNVTDLAYYDPGYEDINLTETSYLNYTATITFPNIAPIVGLSWNTVCPNGTTYTVNYQASNNDGTVDLDSNTITP